jgi:glycosyltransferase involved in cell wall biosynthesis
MKISVITVSFNSAATIGDTLSSLAEQSWPDIEHLVIDGGSTDATLEIVRRSGTRLARLVSERDGGIYDAMNKGVAAATGDIIGFLNADDRYAHKEVLRDVANAMASDDIDAVFGDVAYFRSENPNAVVRRYRSARFRPDRIAWGWMPAHPSLFVRRELFERIGLFSTEFRIAGDFEWIARAFGDGSIRYRYLPEILVRMRIGGVSTGGWRNTALLNREVIRACRANGIQTNWLKVLSKYPAKMIELFRE